MKKMIALVASIAFAFGMVGFAAAQTPAPRAARSREEDGEEARQEDRR